MIDDASEAASEVAPEETDVPPPRSVGIKDVLCIGPVILKSIYLYAGTPLTPFLIGTHPLLLEAVRASTASLIAAGAFASKGQLPLVLVLLAPIPYQMFTDPFMYWAGRRYGRPLIHYLERNDPRWHRRVHRAERWFQKYGAWIILLAYFNPVPNDIFYFLAGESRMRFWLFLAADAVGTAMWLSLIIALGWALGDRAVSVAEAISSHAWQVLVGGIVLIFVWGVFDAWRGMKAREAAEATLETQAED